MATSIDNIHSYRWSVAEFHKLAETGFFIEDDRIELIEGELIEMAPIGSDHSGRVNRLNHTFTAALSDKAIVAVQNPIVLDSNNEPQPDLALLRWRNDFYQAANPTAEDVLLVIEVADSSVRLDRDVKVPLYARFAIPEVWLLDLTKRRLEVYRQPVDGEYSDIKHYREGRVTSNLLADAQIDLAEFFPED